MGALREELIENYFNEEEINDNFDYQKQLSKIAHTLKLREQLVLFPILKIDDDKILLISDTHFGSINQNYHYLDLVYNFASKNNYKSILHGGDLIQGTVEPRLLNFEKIYIQAIKVLSYYPYDKSINNYILLGNHDYLIYHNIDNSLNILKEREDINLLGIKYVYINWNNCLISLSHHMKKSKCKIDIPIIETLIKFHGHRHQLHIMDSHVYLPTLSDDLKKYDNGYSQPGFITAQIDNDELYLNNYVINNKKIIDKGLVLKKEINERVRIK